MRWMRSLVCLTAFKLSTESHSYLYSPNPLDFLKVRFVRWAFNNPTIAAIWTGWGHQRVWWSTAWWTWRGAWAPPTPATPPLNFLTTHSQTEVGWSHHSSSINLFSPGGLNLNLMKTESLWHQHVGYSSGYGQSPHYGLPSSPLPTGAVLWNSFWDQYLGNFGNLWSRLSSLSMWDHEVMPLDLLGQWMIWYGGKIVQWHSYN